MSKLRTGAIVPVKTFSKAKTRLNLSCEKTEDLCKMMLEEVLQTISQSDVIEKITIVSKDESAFKIGKKFDVVEIYDEKEQGVNNAVAMADKYFLDEGFGATIVFPQDVPLMQTEDIRTLYDFQMIDKCVLVVPSRRFDGTNALFRSPVDVMETHYDEDSYKIHLTTANNKSVKSALVLIRRIMLDVDEPEDLQTILKYSKPSISKMLEDLLI
ncbi:MAG TPA: 2-phospho-L-lactate guanylyltransferase [Nitrosopumilaceae archaeon]|nr:2-phospho-L-lactate guanylyltransferase [Nitrosopumilaceae archaeon]